PTCDIPPQWCDVHHGVHWADGGPTTLTNLFLACPTHHQTAHHAGWQVRIAADGLTEWIPPARIDPERKPRPHHRHKPPPTPPPPAQPTGRGTRGAPGGRPNRPPHNPENPPSSANSTRPTDDYPRSGNPPQNPPRPRKHPTETPHTPGPTLEKSAPP